MASINCNLTTFSDVARSGSMFNSSWGTVANAASSNDSRATHGHSQAIPADGYSVWLQGTNLSVEMPTDATIDGIEVHIERRNGDSGTVKDSSLKLVLGGTIQGDDNADTSTSWPGSDGSVTYGGATDLWGLSLTMADVSASGFGAAISMVQDEEFEAAVAPQIDHISMTVYYTEAVSGGRNLMSMGVT